MFYGYGAFGDYVSVAERRAKAQIQIAKLRKSGKEVAPVEIEGRAIAKTFWGKSWCANLESYRDYEYRLPRGRSYVRNGLVVDLKISPRKIEALVSGSSLYRVAIAIAEVPKAQWQAIRRDCAGGIGSLIELLQGRLSKDVMERLCRQRTGLFPTPSEIEFSCNCPDGAIMCKHVAATLYGVGNRLDANPELLFRLRAVDEADLLAGIGTDMALTHKAPASDRILKSKDVSALFGIDMVAAPATPDAGGPAAPPEKRKAGSRRFAKKPVGVGDKTETLLASFGLAPSRSVYRKLCMAAGKNDALRDRAFALLRKSFDGRRRISPAERAKRVALYVDLAIAEERLDEAWGVENKYGCSDKQLLSLARRSEKTRRAEALKAYRRLVEQHVATGGNANYDAVLRLIARMKNLHRRGGTLDEHAVYLADLAERYKNRRGFIKKMKRYSTNLE